MICACGFWGMLSRDIECMIQWKIIYRCSLSACVLWLLLVFEMCTWLILMNQMLVASFFCILPYPKAPKIGSYTCSKSTVKRFNGHVDGPQVQMKKKKPTILLKWLLSFYLPNITSEAQWISFLHCMLSCMHCKAACTCPVIVFTFSLRFLINSVWHLRYVCHLSS